MGGSESKDKDTSSGKSDTKSKDGDTKRKGRSDDGCIGNRRVRTILLSLLMILFFIFAMPYINESREALGSTSTTDVGDTTASQAFAAIFAGAAISIVGAICAVVLFLIPSCEDKLGRVAGFVLVVGGVIYLIGWIVYLVDRNGSPAGDAARETGGGAEQEWNAQLTALFGEALLPAGAAILLGLDAAFQMYENEAFRLSSNLGIICTVSSLCIGAYYAQICPEEPEDSILADIPSAFCTQADGVEAIATGYLILFWICLIYIILYIFTCCTCDCKDKCLIRVIIAVTLVIGGLITAIGYFVYVGGNDKDIYTGDNQDVGVVYYVGYSFLIGGLAVIWALDMAFDDIKND